MKGRSTLAASLAMSGAIAAGVGSFLTWAEISAGPVVERATGISGWEGKATLVAAAVMGTGAVRVFTGGFDAVARLRPAAFIGGLVAAGVGVYTALTAEGQFLNAAGETFSRTAVQAALDSGLLEISLAVGLYAVMAGGVLAISAAIVALGVRAQATPASGRGLTGWVAPSASLPPATTSRDVSPSPWGTPPRPDESP